jgi:hypothetical protein
MPPQPGVFALPYASTHKSQSRAGHGHEGDMGYHGSGGSSRKCLRSKNKEEGRLIG